jgi:hypothetical protein
MVLALVAFILAAIPAALFRQNLRDYQPPPQIPVADTRPPLLSVLIPARNEERSIQAAVDTALGSVGVELEVIVLDDHSDDATAVIVRQLAERDSRVRLVHGPELPDGWCGKQHACWALAQNASHERLLFMDADVRVTSDGLARTVAFLEETGADLVSGIPFQETRTLLERLVIPLFHFVLLGFLPIERMRASRAPAYGAGCGQLMLVRRSAYEKAGGHAAIRASLHDGIMLPRAFRAAGLLTDLFDATGVANCRMYCTGAELWHGLAKNAIEGLGSPLLIVPSTFLLLIGQVFPLVLLGVSIWVAPVAILPALAATICSYYPRAAGVVRFGQSVWGALLHPVGVSILLAIQWYALFCMVLGRPQGWKGRAYGRFVDLSKQTETVHL